MTKRKPAHRAMTGIAGLLAGLLAGEGGAAATEIPDFANRIVSAASGDIDNDGKVDLVLLLTPDEAAGEVDHGLLVMMGSGKDRGQISPKAYYPDMVWGGLPGSMARNRPSVSIAANGTIRLVSHNDAVGRSRWNQTLTLARRGKKLMLAGFSYGSYDTLIPDGRSRKCEVNLLTGKGEREIDGEEEQFSLSLGELTIRDWARYREAGFCGFPE